MLSAALNHQINRDSLLDNLFCRYRICFLKQSFPFLLESTCIRFTFWKWTVKSIFSVWIVKNTTMPIGLWALQEHGENMSLFKWILLKPSQAHQGHYKPNKFCMSWTRYFHKQKGWKGDNCERAPSTGTSSLSIPLRVPGEGIQVSPGLASCFPGSPLLSRSLDWVSPLPGHCRRVVSASPGWDSPPRRSAGTGACQHSFLFRDETQKLAATSAFVWPLALPGMFREVCLHVVSPSVLLRHSCTVGAWALLACLRTP